MVAEYLRNYDSIAYMGYEISRHDPLKIATLHDRNWIQDTPNTKQGNAQI